MISEPDIVKILKEEEKQGKLVFSPPSSKHELDINEPIQDLYQVESPYSRKNRNSTTNNLDKIVAEKEVNYFSDLMEIINFTERVSASLHGDFTDEEIINIVMNEFKNSDKYTGSILLVSDDGKKLKIAGTSSNTSKFREAERVTGYNIKSYKIALKKSHIYSQVINEGKTVQFRIIDLLEELLPKKLITFVNKLINVDKSMHVATPLKLDGEIIGAFAMSSTILVEYFIPSVKNLAVHISHAFEHAAINREQKKAEEMLAESEQQYRNMVEHAPFGIITVDTSGVVRSCNDTFVQMAGYSREELVDKNIAYFPTLPKREAANYIKLFRSILKGNVPESFEFNWIRKDGTLCIGELYISLIKTNDKITGIQAIIRDITETKHTRDKLKETKERYNSLFNSSLDLVYLCDFKGRFIDANNATLKLLGYNRTELQSLTFSSLLDHKQIIKAYDVVKEIRTFGYQKNIQEFKLKRKNGTFIIVESMGSLIYRNGKPYAVQGIARDITERKMTEIFIKNRSEDLELLNLVNKVIYTNQTLNEITKLISKKTGEIFHAYNASIYMISEDKNFLVMKQPGLADKDKKIIQQLTGINLSNFKIPLKKESIYYNVIHENKPKLLNTRKEILQMLRDATDNEMLKKLAPLIAKKLKINSTMLIPLIFEKECIGIIDISREIPFTTTDLKRFENIAKQLTVAINQIILKENKKLSEEKYRDLYDRLRDGSAAVNMDGKITECNSAFRDMLGYTGDEIYQLTYEAITPKKWHQIEAESIREQVLKRGYSDLYEKEYIRKDGTIIPVELTTYLLKDKEGNPTGMWAIVRDITERKKAEREAMASKEHFRTLFNTMVDPVVIVDSKGKFLEATNRVEEITGFKKEELLGKNFLRTKIVTGKSKRILLKSLIKRMAGKKLAPYEVEILTKDGRKLPYEINAARIDYLGKPADMVVFRDVSVRKEAEKKLKELNEELEQKVKERTIKVEQLLAQKDEFINQLGHDLKNPLTPITVLLPTVVNKPDDPDNTERLEIISRNVNYIKDLVLDTLKLARLNSPSSKLDFKELNLLDLVNNIVLDNRLILTQKRLNVENLIDSKINITADELQLKEVINNLTFNAIKYIPQGGTLTFDAEGASDKNFVTVSVKDNGIGMTKEQLNHVFEEFYKADISRHDLASSGLGLTICKRIIEKHGGQIWAESLGPSQGTKIYFTVPYQKKKFRKKSKKRINFMVGK